MRFLWLQVFLATAMVMCIVGSAKADPAGSATGGTAGTQSWAAGCVYNATPPVLTNGQQATVQCGANGSLILSATPSPVCTSVLPFSQTASADLHTATGKSYICSIVLISATQQQVSLIEGTGSTCGTGTAALLGGTSASMAVAANGGFSSVSASPWLKMQTTSDHLCLLQSGVGNVSGTITYADAP